MRPVCVACKVEMRPAKNDYCVEEMADESTPYRLWFADKWACPSCNVEVVMGFAKEPWAEHFDPEYATRRRHADLQYWPRPEMVPAAEAIAKNGRAVA